MVASSVAAVSLGEQAASARIVDMASAEAGTAIAVYNEAEALERMLDDGGPIPIGILRRARSRPSVVLEPSVEERAAERRALRRRFRVYCIACGRSSEASTVPARSSRSRCAHCGGTLLVEPTAD